MFVKHLGVSMKTFEEACGLSSGYVTSMRKGFGPDKLNNVLNAYPQLNRDWLLYGEGNMLKTEKPAVVENGIPYYDVENFECGMPGGFGKALEKANPDGYFNFPWIKNDGNTFCVQAHGNSMVNYDDPIHSISHGSYIALRRNTVRAIQWGEVYALATADGYIIKKLMPSEREDCVRCVSFNSEDFPPFDLPYNEIFDYAVVVGVATINLW
jgi:hypothetical protein